MSFIGKNFCRQVLTWNFGGWEIYIYRQLIYQISAQSEQRIKPGTEIKFWLILHSKIMIFGYFQHGCIFWGNAAWRAVSKKRCGQFITVYYPKKCYFGQFSTSVIMTGGVLMGSCMSELNETFRLVFNTYNMRTWYEEVIVTWGGNRDMRG